MNIRYSYLNDSAFLRFFDKNRIKEQFVKITVLDFIKEKPVRAIEGKVIDGSITLDGSNPVRRSGNLSMIADKYTNDLSNIENIISINKKIYLEIGFKNNTQYYQQYPTIWFPLGVYVVSSPSISHGMDGVKINVTLKDKMCLLNGEIGGTIPAAVDLMDVITYDDDTETDRYVPTMYQTIIELVHHFGNEQLAKIIISGLSTKAHMLEYWSNTQYDIVIYKEDEVYKYCLIDLGKDGELEDGYQEEEDSAPPFPEDTNKEEESTQNNKNIIWAINYKEFIKNKEDVKRYTYGDMVGLLYTDFTYPGKTFELNPGDSVCTGLDKIKSVLGNYEYFYDINGNFVFQEIQNYLNTSETTIRLEELTNEDYRIDRSQGKSVYSFLDNELVMNITNVPQYDMVKNDYIVWGEKKLSDSSIKEIRYHVAIDNRPKVDSVYKGLITKMEDNSGEERWNIVGYPLEYPNVEEMEKARPVPEYFYYVKENDKIYYYDFTDPDKNNRFKVYNDNHEDKVYFEDIYVNDWRTAIYLLGAAAAATGSDINSNYIYYYTELKEHWKETYCIVKENDCYTDKMKEEISENPFNLTYFFDIIDTGSAISEFNISNIGKRTQIEKDENVTCVFEPYLGNFYLIKDYDLESIEIAKEQKFEYLLLDEEVRKSLTMSSMVSAFSQVRNLLYQFTTYNDQINLSALPIYYLEPNTRITVRDVESNIYGDFMMSNITLPLGLGDMSITASRALQKM